MNRAAEPESFFSDLLGETLDATKDRRDLVEVLGRHYPAAGKRRLAHHAGQIWTFVHEMKPGDWIILPSKVKPAIHVAEIAGEYRFNADGPNPYFHYRAVRWLARDIPRSNFDQDLLYSFGAFMAICELRRNDAEKRIRVMATQEWRSSTQGFDIDVTPVGPDDSESHDVQVGADLDEVARDQIARLIIASFKGHGLARLIDAILRAQGYTTHLSPEGPDKGVDILAAPGPLGFGHPRLCVQVKSEDNPVDLPTLNQLIGAMQNTHADQGLLVSWSGFKSSVEREAPSQFFRVRLWDQDALIRELLANYERVDEELRAELPLKRIWVVVRDESD